jgi:hypothetical protein
MVCAEPLIGIEGHRRDFYQRARLPKGRHLDCCARGWRVLEERSVVRIHLGELSRQTRLAESGVACAASGLMHLISWLPANAARAVASS